MNLRNIYSRGFRNRHKRDFGLCLVAFPAVAEIRVSFSVDVFGSCFRVIYPTSVGIRKRRLEINAYDFSTGAISGGGFLSVYISRCIMAGCGRHYRVHAFTHRFIHKGTEYSLQ